MKLISIEKTESLHSVRKLRYAFRIGRLLFSINFNTYFTKIVGYAL